MRTPEATQANTSGATDEPAIPASDELAQVVPPESPFTVRAKARTNIGGAEAPTGDLAAMLSLIVPPLTMGGSAYIHALVKSDFWKMLGPAILESRVVIVPKDTTLRRENAVAHLNNALQILSHVAEIVDGLDVDIQAICDSLGVDDHRGVYPKLAADVKAVGRRVHHARAQLLPPRLDGAVTGGPSDDTPRDPRQLSLVDGGR